MLAGRGGMEGDDAYVCLAVLGLVSPMMGFEWCGCEMRFTHLFTAAPETFYDASVELDWEGRFWAGVWACYGFACHICELKELRRAFL